MIVSAIKEGDADLLGTYLEDANLSNVDLNFEVNKQGTTILMLAATMGE